MVKMRRILLLLTCASFCALLVLVNVTTPSSAGPFGVLFVFLASYIFFVCIGSYFLFVASMIVSRVSLAMRTKKPVKRMSLSRSCHFSIVVALAPIMLIGLQSVGAMSIYSVFLVFLFVSIGCLYVSKVT